MNNQKLDELWKIVDKSLYNEWMELRLNYQIGSITKKEYDIKDSYFKGYYSGFRKLYKTIKETK
jgi:hypothetical protein